MSDNDEGWLDGLKGIKWEYFWSFLPEIDINRKVSMQEKICGLCGEKFIPRENDKRLICYSKKCIKRYNQARQKIHIEKYREEKEERHRKKDQEMINEYEKGKKFGYVYLMKSGNGYYKIGISKKVKNRLDSLKRQFPVEIEVIHYIACSDRRKTEAYLHAKYSSKCIEYEWFQLSQKDIDWISSLKDHELDNIE